MVRSLSLGLSHLLTHICSSQESPESPDSVSVERLIFIEQAQGNILRQDLPRVESLFRSPTSQIADILPSLVGSAIEVMITRDPGPKALKVYQRISREYGEKLITSLHSSENDAEIVLLSSVALSCLVYGGEDGRRIIKESWVYS